jgi:hypothetical protein
MARVFIDGGEGGTVELWDYTQPSLSASTKHSGNYGLVGPMSRFISEKHELYLSSKFYAPVNVGYFMVFYDIGGTAMFSVYYSYQTSSFSVYRGSSGGTLLAQTPAAYPPSEWYLVEVRWKAPTTTDGTDGIVQVKVNGLSPLAIDFTGDNCATSELGVGRVYLGGGVFDDIVCDDSSWIGDTRIGPLVPTGPGNATQWQASAPNTDEDNNWSMVDEGSQAATDYVYTNANDQVDLYACADPSEIIHEVKCVQVGVSCMKVGAPTPQQVQAACRVGGTNYFGSSTPVPSVQYGGASKLWETNPSSGIAWTEEDLDSVEVGMKSVA